MDPFVTADAVTSAPYLGARRSRTGRSRNEGCGARRGAAPLGLMAGYSTVKPCSSAYSTMRSCQAAKPSVMLVLPEMAAPTVSL